MRRSPHARQLRVGNELVSFEALEFGVCCYIIQFSTEVAPLPDQIFQTLHTLSFVLHEEHILPCPPRPVVLNSLSF